MKKIPNYQDYAISKDGSVYGPRGQLKPYTINNNALVVSIRNENGKLTSTVARLMMMTFKPKKNMDNFSVVHKNGDKKDNRIKNLQWVSNDKIQSFTNKEIFHGEPPRKSKITKDIYDRVHRMSFHDISMAKIAAIEKLNKRTVSGILQGNTRRYDKFKNSIDK